MLSPRERATCPDARGTVDLSASPEIHAAGTYILVPVTILRTGTNIPTVKLATIRAEGVVKANQQFSSVLDNDERNENFAVGQRRTPSTAGHHVTSYCSPTYGATWCLVPGTICDSTTRGQPNHDGLLCAGQRVTF